MTTHGPNNPHAPQPYNAEASPPDQLAALLGPLRAYVEAKTNADDTERRERRETPHLRARIIGERMAADEMLALATAAITTLARERDALLREDRALRELHTTNLEFQREMRAALGAVEGELMLDAAKRVRSMYEHWRAEVNAAGVSAQRLMAAKAEAEAQAAADRAALRGLVAAVGQCIPAPASATLFAAWKTARERVCSLPHDSEPCAECGMVWAEPAAAEARLAGRAAPVAPAPLPEPRDGDTWRWCNQHAATVIGVDRRGFWHMSNGMTIHQAEIERGNWVFVKGPHVFTEEERKVLAAMNVPLPVAQRDRNAAEALDTMVDPRALEG